MKLENKYFIKWFSFIILRTIPEDTKNKFRLLEKSLKKLKKTQCHLVFNETCVRNELLPKYTNVRVHDEAARQEPIVLNFRKELMQRQIQEQKLSINRLMSQVSELKKSLCESVNSPVRFKALMFFLQRLLDKEKSEMEQVQLNKLVNLYGGDILLKQNRDSVINLSKVELSSSVIESLSYGMNCHIRTKFNKIKKKIELEKLYFSVNNLVSSNKIVVENDELFKSQLKVFGMKDNRDFNKDVLTKEQRKDLEALGKDDRIIIRKADKSNVFVILDREKYCQQVNELIADETKFEKITENPIPSLKRSLNKYVDTVNAVNDGVTLKKLVGHFEPAYLYGNPKIHKSLINPPLRPIISQICTPTYEISQQLNTIIKDYMPIKYMIESTFEFLTLIKNRTPQNSILASLDVESLFSNVPVLQTIDIILDNVYRNNSKPPPVSISETIMKELLLICTTKSPFKGVDGNLYLQKDGVMMGSPLGPTFANFYMCHVENKIAQEHPEAMPLIYARYVDDIFILTENTEKIFKLKHYFESYSVLKFTYETEKNNQLVFLDTVVTRCNNNLKTTVHTKPTSSGDCINFNSICPDRYKTGVIKTLLHRSYHICNTWESINSEIDRIKQLLTNNNFPMNLIEDTIKKFLDSKINNQQRQQDETCNSIKLFYQSQMTSNYKMEEQQIKEIIGKNIKPSNPAEDIKLHIFYRNKKLRNLVMRNRYHKTEEYHHVVYQYTCTLGECNSSQSYIGYTESTLTERIRNHGQHGSIIRHLREHHSIQRQKTTELLKNVKVIGRASTKQELLLLEALLIQQEKPSLNQQEEGRDRILNVF